MTARERLEGTLVRLEYDWASDEVLLLREQVEEALRDAANNALEQAARTVEEYDGLPGVGEGIEKVVPGRSGGSGHSSQQSLVQAIRALHVPDMETQKRPPPLRESVSD